MTVSLEPIVARRPSRSRNWPHPHVMHFEPQMLTPVDPKFPCSCAAGSKGYLCWAVLEWLRDEAPKRSRNEGVLTRARMAAAVLIERAARAPKRRIPNEQEYAF
jgi:hypothetical protein